MAPVLVIADGGVAGLLACAAAADAGGGSICLPPSDPETRALRAAAVDRQAALYGLSVVAGPEQVKGAAEGELTVRLLVDACYRARAAGISTVVWPVAAGETLDLERASVAADRALLAGRLVSVGEERPVEVRAPYLDYTDRQLADLILDMDLPIWTCWWYDGAGNPAAERERAHWAALLRDAGWVGALPGPELAAKARVSTPNPGSSKTSRSRE